MGRGPVYGGGGHTSAERPAGSWVREGSTVPGGRPRGCPPQIPAGMAGQLVSILLPLALTTYHSAPNALTACPGAVPPAVSAGEEFSGGPLEGSGIVPAAPS